VAITLPWSLLKNKKARMRKAMIITDRQIMKGRRRSMMMVVNLDTKLNIKKRQQRESSLNSQIYLDDLRNTFI
jgi:hypothetical protein